MSKHGDSGRERQALPARQSRVVELRNVSGFGEGQPRSLHCYSERSGSSDYKDIVASFECDLVVVGVECNVLKCALTGQDLVAVERAGYALASAWLFTEASAMRIFGASPGNPACTRFARRALIASSGVVTAQFGESLAEVSRWATLDPQRGGLGRLRGVLRHLARRVDVREIEACVKHCSCRLTERARRPGSRTALLVGGARW